MAKYHYVYKSFEEEGREYIGIRSCDCLPEEDTKYFGSFYDKTFKPTGKAILFIGETRKEVAEIEIELHDFFDVAINPKFANKAKQTSTKFDTAGVPRTEETKRKIGEALSGEKNPNYGIPHTEEWKQAMSGENNPNYGRTGSLHPLSKAVIAIEPDGTQRHFGSGHEAARELTIPQQSLSRHLNTGKQPKRGKWKGWQFFYENR